MAMIKIEDVLDHLSMEMRKALEAAISDVLPDAVVDSRQLSRSFRRAVGRKCNTWERIPDHYVRLD